MSNTATKTKDGLNISLARKALFEGVGLVSKAVATRSSLPILTHVLLRQDADTGRLSLTGCDLEMWIEHTLPASQESMALSAGGAATVPARNLQELLGAMADANVEMDAEALGADKGGGYALNMRCNKAKYKLLGLSPEEFPLLPKIEGGSQFRIAQADLRECIRQTIFACSKDEARAILTGILVVYKDGKLRCVATDTHRLAVRECEVADGTGEERQEIVPARAMQEVLRMLGAGEEGQVTVAITDNQICFRLEDAKAGTDTTIISRLIEGQYPSYERVIPQSADRTLTLEREPFMAAVKRAGIVAREGANRLRFTPALNQGSGNDYLLIEAEAGTIGNAREEVEIAEEGADSPLEIAFNAKYLIDVLSAMTTEGVKIELTEPLRPAVLRPVGPDSWFCVLMPMQVV